MSSGQMGSAPPSRTISSPSRFPFRPPLSLTFPFRVLPSSSASTYSGPVLGARRNLGGRQAPCKRSGTRRSRNLRRFNFPHFHSTLCSLWKTPRPSLTRSPTLESPRAPPSPTVDLARRRILHLGLPPGALHLGRDALGRRLRRDVVHHRRRRRSRDLPLRPRLRRRRAALFERQPGPARTLSAGQAEEQQTRQIAP